MYCIAEKLQNKEKFVIFQEIISQMLIIGNKKIDLITRIGTKKEQK